MSFEIKCKCGKSKKTFLKDLGLPFYIDECCELAGYNHLGEKGTPEFKLEELEAKHLNELKAKLYKYEIRMERARSAAAKEREAVNVEHAKNEILNFESKMASRKAEVDKTRAIEKADEEVEIAKDKLVKAEARLIKADTTKKKSNANKAIESAKTDLNKAIEERKKLED